MAVGEDPIEIKATGVIMSTTFERKRDTDGSSYTAVAGDSAAWVPGSIRVGNSMDVGLGLVLQTWSSDTLREFPQPAKRAGVDMLDFSIHVPIPGGFKNAEVRNLMEPVIVHIPIQDQTANRTCVFYDLNSSAWSTEGCQLQEVATHNISQNLAVCACNHLSKISVMTQSTREIPSINGLCAEHKFDTGARTHAFAHACTSY